MPPTAADRYGHDIVFGHEPSLMMHAVRWPARGKSAAEMQTRRNAGPSSRLWVSSVPTIVDALGLGEAEVSAKGSGATLRSTLNDEAPVANVGAMEKVSNRKRAIPTSRNCSRKRPPRMVSKGSQRTRDGEGER